MLQTPEPVIYLADNLDEQDNLGWCIDILGRGWSEQLFTYNAETSEFMPEGDHSLCIAAGAGSQSAGPFMSRILELAPYASTDAKLKQWVIKGEL